MTGYHPANFGLSRPFRSRVKSRHGTDRRSLNLTLKLLHNSSDSPNTDSKTIRVTRRPIISVTIIIFIR